jgi:hypothetical protein
MFFGRTLRQQARVFIRMADDCDDQHLAERLKAMSKSLEILAEEGDEAPEAFTIALEDNSAIVRS